MKKIILCCLMIFACLISAETFAGNATKNSIKKDVFKFDDCLYRDGARIVFQSGLIVVCNGCSNVSQEDATYQVDMCLLGKAAVIQ
ncbi:MAG: hypothetical protein KGZ74_18865 [Chitinophagaceae bacterium]|nr:hypothetical protein [Chitinophagaceae bacterium]